MKKNMIRIMRGDIALEQRSNGTLVIYSSGMMRKGTG